MVFLETLPGAAHVGKLSYTVWNKQRGKVMFMNETEERAGKIKQVPIFPHRPAHTWKITDKQPDIYVTTIII